MLSRTRYLPKVRPRCSEAVSAARGDDNVHFVLHPVADLLHLSSIIAGAQPEAALYACGPEPMLATAERACADRAARSRSRVRRDRVGRGGRRRAGAIPRARETGDLR
jgi:hypothetical protein